MYNWLLPSGDWVQDDDKKSFFPVRRGTNDVIENQIYLRIVKGVKEHLLDEGSVCGNVFPPEFSHCPYCGAKLNVAELVASDLWLPPYGAGNGLKLFPKKLSLGKGFPKEGAPFLLPSSQGRFAFCVTRLGVKHRILVAIQRDVGQLWASCESKTEKWMPLLGSVGGDSLPAWSWGVAVDSSESGICVPTDKGPVWVTVDWETGTLQMDRADGVSVGSPARLGNNLIAPVMRGGGFALVSKKDVGAAWTDCLAVSDPELVTSQLGKDFAQNAFLGIPVIDEMRGVAYWACRGGYVRVSPADGAAQHAWEFRPWGGSGVSATALLELGPPYYKKGARAGFWQLCEDQCLSVRDGIVNKIFKLDGDASADSEIVECGQFLTTGGASFSWSEDYWDDIHKRNPRIGEQKELRIPLIQFGEKGLALIAKVKPWEGRDEFGLFSDIFCTQRKGTPALVRFVVEGEGVPETVLYAEGVDGVQGGGAGSLFRCELEMLPEISVFVFGGLLYLRLPWNNACYAWPFELMEAR